MCNSENQQWIKNNLHFVVYHGYCSAPVMITYLPTEICMQVAGTVSSGGSCSSHLVSLQNRSRQTFFQSLPLRNLTCRMGSRSISLEVVLGWLSDPAMSGTTNKDNGNCHSYSTDARQFMWQPQDVKSTPPWVAHRLRASFICKAALTSPCLLM